MSMAQGAHGKAVGFGDVQAAEPSGRAGAIGVALSGGGIRSATFSLGVLQALAARRKLASIDYLSTVSGGGYIGAWLSAWIHRAGLATVQEELGAPSAGNGDTPASAEPRPLQWLRRYSNYLTPRLGLFSTDSLTLISIWLRNVVLTLAVLFLAFAVVLLAPRLILLHLYDGIRTRSDWYGYAAVWLGAGLIPAVIMANLSRLSTPREGSRLLTGQLGVGWTVVGPGILAAISASVWLFARPEGASILTPRMLYSGLILIAVVFGLSVYGGWKKLGREARLGTRMAELYVYAQALAIALACGALIMWGLHRAFPYDGSVRGAVAIIALGPAAFLLVAGLVGWIFVGLVGRVFYERSREWWSSMNAMFLSMAALVFLAGLCAFYVPALGAALWHSEWLRGLFGTGWVSSLLLVWFGPRKADVPPQSRWNILTLATVAAVIGMLGFIFLASYLTDMALARGAAAAGVVPLATLVPMKIGGFVDHHIELLCAQIKLAVWCLPYLWWAFGATLLALVVFGMRVDVNKFSLHNMYKNRLIRCYLGASNERRRAHPFTGFDESDDIALRLLAGREQPQRPYHIFNTALNLSQGKNLAWQERKSAAFALTPLYCGFGLSSTQGELSGRLGAGGSVSRFRPTSQYATGDGEEDGFTLGMAMATSGAAASPNAGIHTRPALAFMMTLLNARLGRWSPNPACSSWRRPSPPFGVLYLLQELFGFSNDESRYVYLSDGGHFENTGIYELVRRRCKVILMVDAGADSERGFYDLGRAIRQCRIDFGIDININLNDLRLPAGGALPTSGIAQGTIHYGGQHGDGTLIVIKPTLCADRDEPADVLNYAARNPAFPQQSTADQFFDESQFESYRQLGLYLGNACLKKFGELLPERAAPGREAASIGLVPAVERRSWRERLWPALPWAAAGLLLVLAIFQNTCLSPVWTMAREAQQCSAAVVPMTPVGLSRLCPRNVFLYLDMLAIALYTATFIVGQRQYLAPVLARTRFAGHTRRLLMLAVGLALAGALADLGENVTVLRALALSHVCALTGIETPGWTLAKFILFFVNLGLLLPVWWFGRRRAREEVPAD